MKTMNNAITTTRPLLETAENHASTANVAAAQANEIRPVLEAKCRKRDNWSAIMAASPTHVLSALCLGLAVLDTYMSWVLFTEIIQNKWLGLVPALGVFGLIYKIGQWLRKGISSDNRTWDEYEHQAAHPEKSMLEVKEVVETDTRRDLKWGIISFLTMIVVIGWCSVYRAVSLEERSLAIVDVFPVLFFVVACLSSVFLFYVGKKFKLDWEIRRLSRRLAGQEQCCSNETQKAAHYFHQAEKAGEDTEDMSGDLRACLARFRDQNRIDGSGYTALRAPDRLQALVTHQGRPVPGARVLGLTDYRGQTNLAVTDEHGLARLEWADGSPCLKVVLVNGMPHPNAAGYTEFAEFELAESLPGSAGRSRMPARMSPGS